MITSNIVFNHYYLSDTNKFAYYDGKLYQLTAKSDYTYLFIFDKGNCTEVQITYHLHVGGDKVIDADINKVKFFNTKEDFEKGNATPLRDKDKVTNFLRYRINCTTSENTLLTYIFDGSKAQQFTPDGVITIKSKDFGFHYNGAFYNKLNTFESEGSVYDLNPYTIVDENGNEHKSEPRLHKLMLNDEQKALIDEFDALLDKMSQADIFTYYDSEDGCIRHFSGKSRVKEYGYEVGTAEDNADGRIFTMLDLERVDYGHGDIGYLNCDNDVVFKAE